MSINDIFSQTALMLCVHTKTYQQLQRNVYSFNAVTSRSKLFNNFSIFSICIFSPRFIPLWIDGLFQRWISIFSHHSLTYLLSKWSSSSPSMFTEFLFLWLCSSASILLLFSVILNCEDETQRLPLTTAMMKLGEKPQKEKAEKRKCKGGKKKEVRGVKVSLCCVSMLLVDWWQPLNTPFFPIAFLNFPLTFICTAIKRLQSENAVISFSSLTTNKTTCPAKTSNSKPMYKQCQFILFVYAAMLKMMQGDQQ